MVGVLGGYKVQGKDEESAARLLEDTKAVEAAGAFAVVLECVPESVAGWITEQVNIPVIGIGAGVQTSCFRSDVLWRSSNRYKYWWYS